MNHPLSLTSSLHVRIALTPPPLCMYWSRICYAYTLYSNFTLIQYALYVGNSGDTTESPNMTDKVEDTTTENPAAATEDISGSLSSCGWPGKVSVFIQEGVPQGYLPLTHTVTPIAVYCSVPPLSIVIFMHCGYTCSGVLSPLKLS